MSDAVSKEGDVFTDDRLLKELRGVWPVLPISLLAAADRIEEYCCDAARAEEAVLRCFMATGKTVDDVENGDTIDKMAEHVIRCISETPYRWIPVSERMPPDGEIVVGFWEPLGGTVSRTCFATTVHERGRWRNHEDDDDEYSDASHWMPLPEAPK